MNERTQKQLQARQSSPTGKDLREKRRCDYDVEWLLICSGEAAQGKQGSFFELLNAPQLQTMETEGIRPRRPVGVVALVIGYDTLIN